MAASDCPVCHGSLKIEQMCGTCSGSRMIWSNCSNCNASGYVSGQPCGRCQSGRVQITCTGCYGSGTVSGPCWRNHG